MKPLAFVPVMIWACAFVQASTVVGWTATAECASPGEVWNKHYRSNYEVPLGTYTGRSPYMRRAPTASKPGATPTPSHAPSTQFVSPPTNGCTPKTNFSALIQDLVRITKVMPVEAYLGVEFTAELRVTALACVANVVVRDYVTPGLRYVRSEPSASIEGDQLVWRLGNFNLGQTKTIKITYRPDKEGTFVTCASVAAEPCICASVFVGKPVLAIEMSGPRIALSNSDVTYNIVVKNTGNVTAHNVTLTNPVPEGFSHASGLKGLTFKIGDLAPGQSKQITVTFKAINRGEICVVATATCTNASRVSTDICTVVLVPELKLEKAGTEEQFLGKDAQYNITVINTGDTILTNVLVTDIAPPDTSIVEATGAIIHGKTATWTIPKLKPGEKHKFSIKLTSRTAGTHCNRVNATAASLTNSAETCTIWREVAPTISENK